MKKNKSIDGLTIRSAQKTPHSNTPTKKIRLKSAKTQPKSTPKKITVKSPETNVNKLTETVKTPESKPNKINSEQTVEDFLKPVHAFNFDEQTGELQAIKNQPKASAKNKSKKEKKKPGKVRRTISIIALLIVLTLIGLVCWAVFWGNDIIAKITGGQGNVLDLIKFVEPTYDPLKTDANGRTNILAFGTSGYNMSGDEGDGVHDGAQLTDSIMMISLNQETGDIAMLSLPRDLKASPTCTATGKINEVYWCNGGGADISTEQEAEAATALMTEVGSILGVDFQYYAHLNWGSLVSIVDILGDITITLDEDIYDYYWTGAVYEAGMTYTLNGEEALGLARARHGTTSGDFSRGASQQKILIGIKDKILEKDFSIADFVNLASTLGDNLRTNFSLNEMKSLAHLTFDFDFDSMRQISLYDPAQDIYYMTTGTLDNGISYVFPRAGVNNYGIIQEFVAEQLSNDPRVYEQPAIIVLNATDEVGKAGNERDKLIAEGYNIDTVDNTPENSQFYDDYTIYSNNTKPGTANLLANFYGINIKPISEAPDNITRDYDFVIILGPNPATEEER